MALFRGLPKEILTGNGAEFTRKVMNNEVMTAGLRISLLFQGALPRMDILEFKWEAAG